MQKEMLSLGEAGYSEVTLLGQNVDAYGRDLPGFAQDGALLQRRCHASSLHFGFAGHTLCCDACWEGGTKGLHMAGMYSLVDMHARAAR